MKCIRLNSVWIWRLLPVEKQKPRRPMSGGGLGLSGRQRNRSGKRCCRLSLNQFPRPIRGPDSFDGVTLHRNSYALSDLKYPVGSSHRPAVRNAMRFVCEVADFDGRKPVD